MKTKITIPDTDLTFHPLGLGTVNAGLAWDGADADRIFDTFLDMGGSLIDTAHVYSDWVKPERARSERAIGDWLQRSGKRNHIVLVTKGGTSGYDIRASGYAYQQNEERRYEIRSGVIPQAAANRSYRYIFNHRDDVNQPVEELVEVMEEFRRQGKIRYYGCSNWTTSRMKAADRYCREKGYRGFIANQALLNLGYKYMNPLDDDTLVYADSQMQQYHRENKGNLLMPYMGVCSGFFHKYAAGGADAVKGSPYYTEGNLKTAERVKELCEKYNATVTQAVLGFFGQQDFDCAPLYGPKKCRTGQGSYEDI